MSRIQAHDLKAMIHGPMVWAQAEAGAEHIAPLRMDDDPDMRVADITLRLRGDDSRPEYGTYDIHGLIDFLKKQLSEVQ